MGCRIVWESVEECEKKYGGDEGNGAIQIRGLLFWRKENREHEASMAF
jgi:hypothetical protein